MIEYSLWSRKTSLLRNFLAKGPSAPTLFVTPDPRVVYSVVHPFFMPTNKSKPLWNADDQSAEQHQHDNQRTHPSGVRCGCGMTDRVGPSALGFTGCCPIG